MFETRSRSLEVCWRGTDQVGESPLWEPSTGLLYWVDIWGKRVSALGPDGAAHTWDMPSEAGFIVRNGGPQFMVGLRHGVFEWRPGQQPVALAVPDDELETNRFNDGKLDRQGRLWAGTMSTLQRHPCGSLYQMATRGVLTRVEGGIVVPNTLAWNATGDVMYFSDSWAGAIHAYAYDPEQGRRSGGKVLVEADPRNGDPDGACVDVDGCLWVARFKRGAVFRYTPAGKLDRVIELPVQQVTSCAFGGADMKTLYITTATARMTPEQLQAQPLAGSLFSIDPGAQGLVETHAA